MANKRNIPTIGKVEDKPQAEAKTAECRVSDAVFSLPLAPADPHGYNARHVQVQLNSEQAVVLRRLYLGLDKKGVRLASGKRISSNADVVRYVLEAIA